jgi:hypothetical protein
MLSPCQAGIAYVISASCIVGRLENCHIKERRKFHRGVMFCPVLILKDCCIADISFGDVKGTFPIFMFRFIIHGFDYELSSHRNSRQAVYVERGDRLHSQARLV